MGCKDTRAEVGIAAHVGGVGARGALRDGDAQAVEMALPVFGTEALDSHEIHGLRSEDGTAGGIEERLGYQLAAIEHSVIGEKIGIVGFAQTLAEALAQQGGVESLVESEDGKTLEVGRDGIGTELGKPLTGLGADDPLTGQRLVDPKG